MISLSFSISIRPKNEHFACTIFTYVFLTSNMTNHTMTTWGLRQLNLISTESELFDI